MDLGAIRGEFPLLREVTWLASAGVGPMPRRALAAVSELQERLYLRFDRGAWEEEHGPAERARRAIARLLGVEPAEVALVRSTTEGLNAIAAAIPWREGDNVVITDQEYPANAIPWYHQARLHRLEVRVVRSRGWELPLDAFAEAIDPRTRVVAVSHVQFATGYRVDLPGLAELARRNRSLLVVDGIQAVGALAVRPRDLGVDALACGGYKWLCGPIGTGFLYVRRELAEGLLPRTLGYRNISARERGEIWEEVCGGDGWVRDFSSPATGALRFEGVGLNPPLLAGLAAAVELLLEVGPEAVEGRVLGLSGHLIRRLRASGYEVLTPEAPGRRAGIVLLRGPWDLSRPRARAELEARLLSAGIKVSIRAGGVRVSCHFFNTEDDLEALLGALAKACGGA